ncbi:unnamed protein product [Rotaria magnacalcarata]|uniref:Uncharacterized protein n=2 Tax=Rotaria magnacalcarata TaxID=392030 RepID=A0A819WG15_9BILA|nr:unnamed protein product [Rotaria magnacalcarata]CAF4123144.1 unnamed protein product [Rotaria magnacalcarata]
MSTRLHRTAILQAITCTLKAFNFEADSALIERAVVNINDDPNNIQLLTNLKQKLGRLPSRANLNMHEEML